MNAPAIVPINYIERKPDSDKYRIVGKGVTVDFLSLFINDPEWDIGRIEAEYGVTPSEIHAAWSFYYDHQAEIDERMKHLENTETAHDHDKREQMVRRYCERTGRDFP
jgi:uncharacterized protein (DUF433 family)